MARTSPGLYRRGTIRRSLSWRTNQLLLWFRSHSGVTASWTPCATVGIASTSIGRALSCSPSWRGTGLIGDPRQTSERSLNTRDIVENWVASLRSQIEHYLSFEGNNGATMVNNLDWT